MTGPEIDGREVAGEEDVEPSLSRLDPRLIACNVLECRV
jgi:hypothetical protein